MASVGEILKREREKKGYTLKQVEKEIRIRQKFLNNIENNQWEPLSSKVYINGIIKNYSEFLGLDPEKILAFFRRDYEKKEEVSFKKRVASHYLNAESRKIVFGFLGTVVFIFIAYFIYQLNLYLSKPQIVILKPDKTIFRSVDSVDIYGKTNKESSIVIYGDKVYADKDGNFQYRFPLKKGKNILKIDVIGANGKKTQLVKEYILE